MLKCTKSALHAALNRQQPKRGCLFHSDQGAKYAAYEYRDYLKASGLAQSMGRKATPQDNAKVESILSHIKRRTDL